MRLDVLSQDLVKFRSHEIGYHDECIALIFDRHLGSAAVPVKYQNDWKSLNQNLTGSTLYEILR